MKKIKVDSFLLLDKKNNEEYNYYNQDVDYNILDIDNSIDILKLEINLFSSNLNLNISGINNIKKRIDILINFCSSNNNAKININYLCKNEKTLDIKVNGKIIENFSNNKIIFLLNGIIDEENTSVIMKPIFEVSSNELEANHSCNIGAINKDILWFLMSRNFSKTEAIKKIIWSHFHLVLKNLNEDESNYFEKIISEKI